MKRVITRPCAEHGAQVWRQPSLFARWSLNNNPFARARPDDSALILLTTDEAVHVIFVRDADDYPLADELPSGLIAKHRLTREPNAMYEDPNSMAYQPTW